MATLTEKKLGPAALAIPKFFSSSPRTDAALPQTALAWAIEKVKTPDSLASLVTRLLHNVAIFRSLDEALAFKKNGTDLAAATLAGEFVSSEGVVFGGSRDTSADSVLERKARISALSAEYSHICQKRDALLRERDDASTQLEKTRRDFEEIRAHHEIADREQSASENKILFLERELHEIEQKIEHLRSEQSTLAQQIEVADERITKLEQELTAERVQLESQQAQQRAVEAAREKAAASEEEASHQSNELRLALATEQQRYQNLVAQRQPMTDRETELSDMIASRQTEIANFENRLESQTDESRDAEGAIQKQTAQRAEMEAMVATFAGQRTECLSTTNELETHLRALRNSLSELHDARSKHQVRETQLQLQIDNVAEHISRRYQLDIRESAPDQVAFEKTLRAQLKRNEKLEDGAPATPDSPELAPPEVEKIIEDLTRQLDNMGPVNLDAVHEYDELEERYRFLESQNNDLTTSRRELLDVIAQINSTTKKLFAETFTQVRTNFREMFAELFSGGRADLSLLDENDPLNCGIEISAKPPGKQLQSISLLSGGERAMTAVALLFAIYMVRPSPFCILDEVDAPLDESNINRFISVLERFVKQSQFIIITHNKRTIAKANVLYGVTMEERGVSKLIGMKLVPRAAEHETAKRETVSSQRQFALAENRHTEQKPSFAAR